MEIDSRAIAATYRNSSDEEIAALAAEPESLTEIARAALDVEIKHRGLSKVQLQKLHARELHRESRFDQMEAVRRKKTALYLLTKNDPKGMLLFVAVLVAIGAFMWLRSLLR
jgi:hypothetical protein